MCIYLGDSPELKYNSREHVFPAGLGGKQRLDRGVVSDQANARFSQIEMKLMRQSMLSIDRAILGPGDRGSLAPNKASESLVTVGRNNNGRPVLSYLSAGKPYGIPQAHIFKNRLNISIPPTQKENQPKKNNNSKRCSSNMRTSMFI